MPSICRNQRCCEIDRKLTIDKIPNTIYSYFTMDNSPKQVPGTHESGSEMPMQRSGMAKNIALIGAMIGTAIGNIGCEPGPHRKHPINAPVTNAKDTDPKHSNMESMADINGFRIVASTEDVLKYGKDQPKNENGGKAKYVPSEKEGGVTRDKNSADFSF